MCVIKHSVAELAREAEQRRMSCSMMQSEKRRVSTIDAFKHIAARARRFV